MNAWWGRMGYSECCPTGSKCEPAYCSTFAADIISSRWCNSDTSSCTIPVNTVSFGNPCMDLNGLNLQYQYFCL